MHRIVQAFLNSVRAFRVLAAGETAFRQELVVLVLSVPAAWWLSDAWPRFAMLIGGILILLMVEVLNTAVEAACNAVSRDFDRDIQIAKDCGSLAVLIAVLLNVMIWGLALLQKLGWIG